MGRLSEVRIYPRMLRRDPRGWLLKTLAGDEDGIDAGVGEVYVTLSLPGEARGHHFHPRTREWFTVVQGRGLLVLEAPGTGERRSIRLSLEAPVTVEVPPGLAHVIMAEGEGPMVLVAVASLPYDPADVVPYRIAIPEGMDAASSGDSSSHEVSRSDRKGEGA